MLELRTDYLENLTPETAAQLIRYSKNLPDALPVITTCRDKSQGGAIDYPLDLRIRTLTAAVKAGSNLIDLEYQNLKQPGVKQKIKTALAEKSFTRLILSAHNFHSKFGDIKELCEQILAGQPDAIPKLVYKANCIDDCFEAFDLLHNTDSDLITFCMGELGMTSRIIAKKLDSFVTFASLDEDSATAPGQITIEKFKDLYHYDSITPDTRMYGLVGSPVAHSAGPTIHNASFAAANLDKLYLPLNVLPGEENFQSFMQNVISRPWLGFHVFSVTLPHKQNALQYTRQNDGCIEPLTEKIGAANTLIIDTDRKLSAYNTDYAGAMQAIIAGIGSSEKLKNMTAAIIGAGGAARAVIAGLDNAGAKITIYNRTVEKAENLAREFNCDYAGLDQLKNLNAHLVVNCTSLGMSPNVNASPIPPEYLNKNMAVFDAIYNPPETMLLKNAKKIGAKTISGLDMFVNQAAEQFKLFTGQKPDKKLMRKKICECFFPE